MENIPLDRSRLRKLVEQCKHLNVFPLDLPLYYRDASTSKPISDLMVELVNECIQYLSIMDKDEIQSVTKSLPPGIRGILDYDYDLKEKPSLERVAFGYIVTAVNDAYWSLKQVIAGSLSDSRVLVEYPEIQQFIDDDGLLCINDDFTLLESGIAYKSHVIHYHQFLRRSYRSNPNFDFLGRLSAYYSQSKHTNQFRVAIDHYRLMPREFLRHILEMDMWYGTRFNRARLDEPRDIGLSVVKRIRPSIFDTTSKLDRTEFYWSEKDGIKSLEIEEISNTDYQFDSYYLNKYVHAERDIRQHTLRHFDGAVKVYLQDAYASRFTSSIPREPRAYKKIKLFRINGDIDVDQWLDLISFFYRGNEMIMEYFNPEQFEQTFGEEIRQYRSSHQ